MGKRIEKMKNEEIRNISNIIREARLRWLGRVDRKTEEDVVTRTWKWVDTER